MDAKEIIITETSEDKGGLEGKQQGGDFIQNISNWLAARGKVNIKSKVVFYRLLATMVNAGLSIMKAAMVLEKQEKNATMRHVYRRIIEDIRIGKNLSVSLREANCGFEESEIAMIEAGEKTGKMNDALRQLADLVEKTASMGKKLKGALIYPASIVVTMTAVIIILMVKVIPGLIEIFPDKTKLPDSTKTLIQISDFMVAYWWIFPIIFISLVTGLFIWRKTSAGLYYMDKGMINIPIFGMLTQKVILSRFARMFANLFGSGISLVESLRIIASAMGNEVYRQRVMLLRDDMKRGVKMGEALEGDKLFPDMMIQLIRIGEETASLDRVIVKVADFYDEEVDTLIGSINKLIEPIIMVTMAGLVGGIAIAVMEPLAKMSEMMGGS